METGRTRVPQVVKKGWLLGPEQRALAWLFVRFIKSASPDRARALIVAGGIIALAGYLLGARDSFALWVASAGLVVNWLGMMFSVELDRFQGHQRTNYGFWIDRIACLLGDVLIAAGLCLSGYIWPLIIETAVSVYILKSVYELMRTRRLGVLLMGPGGLGPTEVRLALLILNALLFFFSPRALMPLVGTLSYADVLTSCTVLVYSAYLVLAVLQEASNTSSSE